VSRASQPTPGSLADATPDADPEAVARAILLRQLTMGPRTRAQLEQALARRNVPSQFAQALLDRFTEGGLIDDAAYAQALIRSDAAAGSLSRRRVAQRLRHKGVSPEITAIAVAGIDQDEEFDAALDLARRRLPRMLSLDPVTRRRRLAGLLARRGYDGSIVPQVLGRVLDDSTGDDDQVP
jgi:regulatory protein